MNPNSARNPAIYVHVLILLAWLLWQPANVIAAEQYHAVPDKSTLKIDLHRYGYATVESERDRLAFRFLDHTVAFLDDRTLAISFFAHNADAIGLSTRKRHSGSPFVFRTVFIDLASGESRAQRSWANSGYQNSFVPLENGKFLVQSLESVTIYSSKIEQIANRDFKVQGDVLPRFAASPSGSSLFKLQDSWNAKSEQWVTGIDVLNQTTLESSSSTLVSGMERESLSDGQIAYTYQPAPHSPTDYADSHWNNLFIKNFAKVEKPFTFPKPETPKAKLLADHKWSAATFITNDVVALTGDSSHLVLMKSGGELFADMNFRKHQVGPVFATARERERFGFTVLQMEGPTMVKNIDLNVYDIADRKIVFRVTVKPLPQGKFWFALSPDGRLLAIQNDETVYVWPLP